MLQHTAYHPQLSDIRMVNIVPFFFFLERGGTYDTVKSSMAERRDISCKGELQADCSINTTSKLESSDLVRYGLS